MRFPLVINRGKSPTNGSLWRKRSQHGGVAIAMLDYQRGIRNWTCNNYGRVQQILLICQAAFPARIVDIDYTKPQHANWTAGKYGGNIIKLLPWFHTEIGIFFGGCYLIEYRSQHQGTQRAELLPDSLTESVCANHKGLLYSPWWWSNTHFLSLKLLSSMLGSNFHDS